MQTGVLNLISAPLPSPAPETVLSFKPFIEFLRKRREGANTHQTKIFQYVIEQFEQHPELLEGVEVEDIHKYEPLLQLIYTTLNPAVADEQQQFWALSLPIRPVIFYSTNALFHTVDSMLRNSMENNVVPISPDDLLKDKLAYSYSFILEKCYGLTNFFTKGLVRALKDKRSGLLKYYRQTLDTRFINISTTRPLPELDLTKLQTPGLENKYLLPQLQEWLPLDMFRFEGFSISSMEEVTSQYAAESIKSLLLDHRSVHEEDYYTRFISSLKSLVGNNDIEFGLLPFLKVNDRLVFMDTPCNNSVLVRSSKQYGLMGPAFQSLTLEYIGNARLYFLKEITPEDEKRKEAFRALKAAGVVSYAMLPIYFNNALIGALEVYSKKPDELTLGVLSKLDPAMSLMAQLLKNTVDEFEENIERVIKEKFTAVQPSVQWKFNEVAWHYIQQTEVSPGSQLNEDISFEQVYPLYGAIDIRNSTIQRNAALRMDMLVQFETLLHVLQALKTETGFGLLDEKIFVARQWLGKIEPSSSTFNEEILLNEYLDNDILPFLQTFTKGNSRLENIADEYFQAIDSFTGSAHQHRRELETSMNTIIAAVNNYLDMLKDEIQTAYPAYFEKIRTDGVEYDIYIGQSITPEKPFSDIYIKNLRLMQLTSMAAIAKYTHSLQEHLNKPIETTQLIFIHSHPIDIKFRTDEKRFDVEGAYNIRYHIIKKRIDKVRIRDTQERLTQPNKIALVYFNQKEADEYINYIQYLQGEGLLKEGLEVLELEELQGVAGLKALRVEVVIN